MSDECGRNSYLSFSDRDSASNTNNLLFYFHQENISREHQLNSSRNSLIISTSTNNSIPDVDTVLLRGKSDYENVEYWLLVAQEFAKVYKFREALKTLEDYRELIDSFIDSKDGQGLHVFYRKGFTYYKMYLYDDALRSFKEAEKCGRQVLMTSKNAENFRAIYNMMADVYIQSRQFEISKAYSDTALSIVETFFKDALAERIPTITIRAELLYTWRSNEENPKKHIDDLEKAEILLKEVLKYREDKGDDRMIGFTYLQMTQMYIRWARRDKRKLEGAIDCLEKGFKHSSISAPSEEYCMIARHWYNKGLILLLETGLQEDSVKREEAKDCCRKGIRMVDKGLPRNNLFSIQFKEDYEERFGEKYVMNDPSEDLSDLESV